MMRWLFAALVLANVGLLMWASWHRDGSGETIAARPVHHPELMVPLSTPGVALKSKRNEKTEAPLVAAKPRPRCVDIGPLAKEAAASAVSWLQSEKLGHSTRTEERQVETSTWVHLGPFENKKQAEQRLRELKKIGIGDVLIMNDAQGAAAISLGLFNQPENANKRMEELVQKGIAAKSQVRTRNETFTWLDLRLPEPADAALTRLRSRDWGTGVEVRDAACPAETPPAPTPAPAAENAPPG
jgi:hypothetical protein